jgi:hypothetical protein
MSSARTDPIPAAQPDPARAAPAAGQPAHVSQLGRRLRVLGAPDQGILR